MTKFCKINLLAITIIILICCPVFAQLSAHKNHKETFGKVEIKFVEKKLKPNLYKSENTKSLTRSIFGFLPYWEYRNYEFLRYDLLTHIALFDFPVDEYGVITHEQSILPYWQSVINQSHSNGIKVLMSVTNFDSVQINKIINTESAKNVFYENVKSIINQHNLDGIIVDFEAPKISDRGTPMNEFINDLSSFIKSEKPNAEIAFATPAVNWGGWWDFQGLAQICDYLFLMGYDYYGNWSDKTGPTSPLSGDSQNLERSVDFHYSDVVNNFPEKLILGIPYYGVHFKAENKNVGSQKVDTVLSPLYRQSIEVYDEHSKFWINSFNVPYTFWQEGNLWNQYFVDDESSLSLKYDLAISRNLKGVGIWALGYDGQQPELWNLLAQKFETTVAVDDENLEIPTDFILKQNYPNPFNPETKIEFVVNEQAEVKLEIFNILGESIVSFEKTISSSGNYNFIWNGRNRYDNHVPSGMYIYQMIIKRNSGQISTAIKKMLLVK